MSFIEVFREEYLAVVSGSTSGQSLRVDKFVVIDQLYS